MDEKTIKVDVERIDNPAQTDSPASATRPPASSLSWLFIALCVVYMLSPIDAIPDTIPIAGWADDALALVAATAQVVQNTTTGMGATIAKAVKWGAVGLVVIIGLLALIAGAVILSLFRNG